MAKENKNIYNWGILGCGRISCDFATCLSKHPRAKIVGCAARSLDSAKNFGAKFEIENCYDSYEKLAQDKSIDIIYVGNLPPAHYDSVLLCLKNKKHVLCEKPIGMNSNQVSDMIDCANKNKCLLLEGMWTRFFPCIRRINDLIHSKHAIGEIISFKGDLGLNKDKTRPRDWDPKLGAGATLGLGVYVIAPLLMVFGNEYPKQINAMGSLVNGVDAMMSASIKFKNNDKQFANINCNLFVNTPEIHYICGTKGMITIHSPAHCPTSFTLTQFGNSDYNNNKSDPNNSVGKRDIISETKEEFALPKGFKNGFIFPNSEGLYYEITEISNCIDNGLIQSKYYTHKEMLVMHQIMDQIRKQIGLRYPQDNNSH